LTPEAKKEIRKVAKELRAEDTVEKKRKRAEKEAKLGARMRALPDAKFGVIVADPEWHDEVWSDETGMDRHAANHYPTSTEEVIASRNVSSIAADDCVLWLWVTNQHLAIGLEVMKAWGFAYKSNYCWGKDHISLGRWQRGKHELLLIGTRGVPPCPAPGTQWESLILAPKSEHSAKPECFLEMIEEYFPTLPKIELNRRGPARAGWEAWGAEADVPQQQSLLPAEAAE
jgi:N6-adenosine-specific RNA methylase IME4